MPESESEPKYPETIELIFGECSRRLKSRKLELNLTDAEIAGDFDRKIVNRILNNTRTRNNPYLIPPAYAKPLVDKLLLKSDCELYWGDINDEGFIESIFCNLVTDVLDEWFWHESYLSDIREKVGIIQKVLLDDVAYAKIYPHLDSSFEAEDAEGDSVPLSPFAYVNNNRHISDAERKHIRKNAIRRLFNNTRPIDMFRRFFSETNNSGENRGFSKLEKRLDNFVDNSLMPFTQANIPNERSLGLRVYSIVAADLGNYVFSDLINAQITDEGYERSTSTEQDEIMQSLMEAGRDYINKIEGIQARLDAILRKEKFGC